MLLKKFQIAPSCVVVVHLTCDLITSYQREVFYRMVEAEKVVARHVNSSTLILAIMHASQIEVI